MLTWPANNGRCSPMTSPTQGGIYSGEDHVQSSKVDWSLRTRVRHVGRGRVRRWVYDEVSNGLVRVHQLGRQSLFPADPRPTVVLLERELRRHRRVRCADGVVDHGRKGDQANLLSRGQYESQPRYAGSAGARDGERQARGDIAQLFRELPLIAGCLLLRGGRRHLQERESG